MSDREYNFEVTKELLLSGMYYACYKNNDRFYVTASKDNKFYLYDLKTNEYYIEINFDYWKEFNQWSVYPIISNKYTLNNKHLGSDFDDFAKENNIKLKRDINWAMKMLESGKIMTREGNPKIYLFPPGKYDNSNVQISVEDLFAEDWEIFHLKTFKDVLDDLYKGKSIRRKSWHPDWEVGEYSECVLIRYADLLADDWEVIDVVDKVNKQQEQILKDRNEL